MLSFFIFIYVQNAFFNDKSVIVGNNVSPPVLVVFLNTILFLAFLFLPLFVFSSIENKFKPYMFKGALICSIFLLLIQVAPMPFLVSAYKKAENNSSKNNIRKELRLSGEEEFTVSSKTNMIVFILDTFNSDSFEEFICLNPEAKEELKDFVFLTT